MTKANNRIPKKVDEAVEWLMVDMPLKGRVRLANFSEEDLIDLEFSFGTYIRKAFGLLSENSELMNDCQKLAGGVYLQPDKTAPVIIKEL